MFLFNQTYLSCFNPSTSRDFAGGERSGDSVRAKKRPVRCHEHQRKTLRLGKKDFPSGLIWLNVLLIVWKSPLSFRSKSAVSPQPQHAVGDIVPMLYEMK